jgi:hypothetical protein
MTVLVVVTMDAVTLDVSVEADPGGRRALQNLSGSRYNPNLVAFLRAIVCARDRRAVRAPRHAPARSMYGHLSGM